MKFRILFPIFLFCCATAAWGKPHTQVRIGLILPMTGDTVVYGTDAISLAPLLEKRFNQKSTRYRYKIIAEDGQCGSGRAAISAAQKLIELDRVVAIVAACSGEVLQIAPYLERKKIPLLGFAASHPDVSQAGEYVFRVYPSMKEGVSLLAQHLSTIPDLRLAVLTEESSFTAGIRDQLLAQIGKQVVHTADFSSTETDFRSIFLRAQSKQPNAWYLNSVSPRSYQTQFTQLRALGLNGQVFSYHQPADADVLKNLGAAQNGVLFLDIPEPAGTMEEFQTIRREFLQQHPEGPRAALLMSTSFDALTAVFHAIETVGPDSGPKLQKYLSAYQAQAAVGHLAFDENGDAKDLRFVLRQIKNAAAETLTLGKP